VALSRRTRLLRCLPSDLAASFASAFIPRRGTAGPHNLASEETNLAFTLPGDSQGAFSKA